MTLPVYKVWASSASAYKCTQTLPLYSHLSGSHLSVSFKHPLHRVLISVTSVMAASGRVLSATSKINYTHLHTHVVQQVGCFNFCFCFCFLLLPLLYIFYLYLFPFLFVLCSVNFYYYFCSRLKILFTNLPVLFYFHCRHTCLEMAMAIANTLIYGPKHI